MPIFPTVHLSFLSKHPHIFKYSRSSGSINHPIWVPCARQYLIFFKIFVVLCPGERISIIQSGAISKRHWFLTNLIINILTRWLRLGHSQKLCWQLGNTDSFAALLIRNTHILETSLDHFPFQKCKETRSISSSHHRIIMGF
jgi:hypothetical protein